VKSFTPDTIMGGFRRAGLHPLDHSTVLSLPMLDARGRGSSVSPQSVMQELVNKRRLLRENVCIQPAVLRRGSLDTTSGLVLTEDIALKLLEEQEECAPPQDS